MDYGIAVYLVGLSVLDIKKKKIPLIMMLILMVTIGIYSGLRTDIKDIIFGIIPGIVLCLIAVVLPQCMGIGDGLLVVICGTYLGWRDTCVWIMFSFLLAAVFGLCFLGRKKRRCEIPFIPFLTLVYIGGLLCWE